MAGRKPLPTAVKKVKGNPGKRAVEDIAPDLPVAGYVPPPKHVTAQKHAGDVWKQTLPLLIDMGVISVHDMNAFAQYCVAVGMHREATILLGEQQMVYESETEGGGIIERKSPYIEIINSTAKLAQSFASEFGLTPSSRARLGVAAKKDKNPLSEFFGPPASGPLPRH